jgi:glycyl-tRNA synthetase
MGWAELEGIASRTDYDLKRHSEFSGKSLEYFDDETNEHYIPYVIEPSAGVDRSFLALLCDAYDEEIDENGEERVVLRLSPKLASYQAAVLPLSRKAPLAELARNVYGELKKDLMVTYDESQSIGRRYRRQDEIGTPFDITVDFQSLEDNMATIRDRDTMRQLRTPIPKLKDVLDAKLSGEPFDILPEGSTYWLGF